MKTLPVLLAGVLLLAGCGSPPAVQRLLDGPPGGSRPRPADAPVAVLAAEDGRADPRVIGTLHFEDKAAQCLCLPLAVGGATKGDFPITAEQSVGDLVDDALLGRLDAEGLHAAYGRAASAVTVRAHVRSWEFLCAAEHWGGGSHRIKDRARIDLELEVTEGGRSTWKGSTAVERKAERSTGCDAQGMPPQDIDIAVQTVREAVATLAMDPGFKAAVYAREDAACAALLQGAEAAAARKDFGEALRASTEAFRRIRGEEARGRALTLMAGYYRALSPKPPLTEEVRRLNVLAEGAFREKQYERALGYYGQALDLNPCWPQGLYNTGLLCGETGRFAEAVTRLKRYLELSPEAADAREVQDRIYLWEEKARGR